MGHRTPAAQGDISNKYHFLLNVVVREEIINPILRIMGHRKGDFSSVDREKHISFAGKTSKYIDYNLTLWESNF